MSILGPILKIVGLSIGIKIFTDFLGYLTEEPCDFCGSKDETKECLKCGKNVCRGCGRGVTWETYKDWSVSNDGRYRLDPQHIDIGRSCLSHHEDRSKIFRAIDKSERVKVFSANYEGRAPKIAKNIFIITSEAYRDRNDAKRELKLLAAMEGCDAVVNAEFVREETSDSENLIIFILCGSIKV